MSNACNQLIQASLAILVLHSIQESLLFTQPKSLRVFIIGALKYSGPWISMTSCVHLQTASRIRIFPNADIVINGVCRTPIVKHSNNHDTLHQWACTYLSRCISHMCKPWIVLLNNFCNAEEETLVHPKSPAKIFLWIG